MIEDQRLNQKDGEKGLRTNVPIGLGGPNVPGAGETRRQSGERQKALAGRGREHWVRLGAGFWNRLYQFRAGRSLVTVTSAGVATTCMAVHVDFGA